jgi:hypothetical protein
MSFVYSGAPDECGYHLTPYNADGVCEYCIEEDRAKMEHLKSFARLIFHAPSNPSNDILKEAAARLLIQAGESQKLQGL